MIRPSTGMVLAGGLATVLTLAIAWPVILAPNAFIYGHEILGRQGDAYALIHQFAGGGPAGPFHQPLLDLPGRLLARLVSPVFAFNALVLLSFPLTAMATYAFARYLHGSHGAALVAALVFAFAPIRLAQAAYHADLMQTEWLPLYFLALVALVDRATSLRVLALAATAVALWLSSYYWGLVGAVLTPVLLAAYWVIRPDANRNLRPLLWPAAVLGGLAILAGVVLAARQAGPFAVPAGLVMPIEDVGFFRARWWAYFTPSVDHPLLGALASARFDRGGIDFQLLEQQLYLGYVFLALAVAGIGIAVWRWERRWLFLLPIAGAAIVAAMISVSPASGVCEGSAAPGCLGYQVMPLLRAYGRFGMAVSLMVAIAAGVGVSLLASTAFWARYGVAVLLALGVFEYWPLPARAHDVLPSSGHRWVASDPGARRTLDCFPGSPSEESVPWLMPQPITLLSPSFPTCADPQLGARLATLGYTHVIVRERNTTSRLPNPTPAGITVAQQLEDATVYAVSGQPPAIVVVAADGFFGFEHQGDDWWRWMSPTGTWTVRNTTTTPMRVQLAVDLVPMGLPRRLTIALDGAPAGRLDLPITRSDYLIGPFTLAPGDHALTFVADGPPTRPSDVEESKDRRPLTVAFRKERWAEIESQ